jgi:hypothetical protein
MEQLARELDLGQYLLLLNSDGSMELHTQDEESQGMSLDREETYRLYMALHAHLQPGLGRKQCSTDNREKPNML